MPDELDNFEQSLSEDLSKKLVSIDCFSCLLQYPWSYCGAIKAFFRL